MSDEPQILARWVDPTIDDLKTALGEANKQIDTLQEENKKLESILKLREDVIITQHNKIDKTIEYLKLFDRDSDMINHSIIRGALNILQGDDNSENN